MDVKQPFINIVCYATEMKVKPYTKLLTTGLKSASSLSQYPDINMILEWFSL